VVTIAHISDPHVGSPYFVPNLMNRVIVELNELAPDVVICSGDLTNEGYRQEYKNWVAYAERIRAPMYTVPGNHDARNVGYLHFEELIGPRRWDVDVAGVRIVGVDSSEPDINEGQVGRERYDWIHERFAPAADLKVFVLHHHLLPIPGTGRERSTVMDAGDLLEELIGAGVNVVLSGHKHVPYVWRLEDLWIANAGTVASLRGYRLAPLVWAVGAGAELRQTLGTAVFFGMIGVTAFGLIFTPAFYVVARWFAHPRRRQQAPTPHPAE